VLARVPRDRQPLLLAIAERMAGERYRRWADDPALVMHRTRLLACAEREEEIASRIEGLRADAASVQGQLRADHPDLGDINRELFAGRPLAEQMSIQARGERLGSLTWQSFAAAASDDATRATFAACASLEEASAAVLEEILAITAGTPLEAKRLNTAELEAGLPDVRLSPRDGGALRLIVRRPAVNRREVVDEAQLDTELGLLGDNWKQRGSRATADGSAHPDMQLNIMNARAAALVAPDPGRWALAGDQLFLDLDLSGENLPVGTRLALGAAVIEITAPPHTGCRKFVARFGADAMAFVNSPQGRALNLRGINAKVIRGGTIRVGDVARKLSPPP
jgi:hypothetical protein